LVLLGYAAFIWMILPLRSWQQLPRVEKMDASSVVKPRGAAVWWRLVWPAVLLELCLSSIALPAMAQTNLVTNGTFQVTGGSTSFQFGTYGSYSNSTESLTGWSSPGGYNYVFLPTSTVATGYYGNLSLAGPSTGSANGFTGAGPGNSNFVALDSDYGTEAMTQTINGLTAGKTYVVSFAWAGAQQSGASGATTDNLTVNLGTNSNTAQTTKTINVANQGFSGWMNQTFSFVATTSSEVLSFLAAGQPSVPPFVLVANVSLTQAPEPASAAVLITGFAALVGLGRKHRRRLFAPKMRGA
jgi:hypothetical protein